IQTKRTSHALLMGMFTGASYLTYTSSYVAGPVVLVTGFCVCILDRSYIKGFLKSFIVTIVLLLPFITYAVFVNNFFVQRIFEVNAFSGSWADSSTQLKQGQPILSVV